MGRKAKGAAPKPADDRVTVLNIKGSTEDRDFVQALSAETGVPISEITRRAIAAWARRRGAKRKPPGDWHIED